MIAKPLTVKAFSRATGHSPRQVRKAIELGEIRTVRFAGQVLIPQAEADRINEAGGGVEIDAVRRALRQIRILS